MSDGSHIVQSSDERVSRSNRAPSALPPSREGVVVSKPHPRCCPKPRSPAWTRRSCWRTACSASPASAWAASRSRRTSGRFPTSSPRAGNRVLVTRVPSIAGVEQRAGRLGEQILRAFPDEPVHVIGHSMGGLDARRLLADPAWQRRILSLTTIGTPHLGTALADFAKLRVGRIFRLLSSWESIPRVASTSPAAPRDDSTASTRRPPDLAVHLGGRQPDARNGVLAPHAHFRRTLGARRTNDGLVPIDSALAFGTPLPHWPVDHLRQMNWMERDESTSGARAARRSLRSPGAASRVSRIRKRLERRGTAHSRTAPPGVNHHAHRARLDPPRDPENRRGRRPCLGRRSAALPSHTSPTPADPERIRRENEHPGTRDWMTTNVRIDPQTKYRSPWIEGYASKTSVRPGEIDRDSRQHQSRLAVHARDLSAGLLPGPRRAAHDEDRAVQGDGPARPARRPQAASRMHLGTRARRSRSPPIGPAASTWAS